MAGLSGIFLVSFLAASVIPLSSEGVVAWAQLEGYHWFWVFFVATLGNSLGGMTNYLLGYFGKMVWLKRFSGVKESQMGKWSVTVSKYGAPIAFFCWLPFIGDIFGVILGCFKVNPWIVGTYMTIGKGLRYLVVLYLAGLF